MNLVDSHCHLDRLNLDPEFANLNAQIKHTQQAGIKYLLNICIDKANWQAVTDIASNNNNVFCAVGIHPESSDTENITHEQLTAIAQHPKAIAIGETGLDYFHKNIPAKFQQQSFKTHIRVAVEQQMPLVVHTREAETDTIKILKSENANKIGGVLHCFTGSLAMAELALGLGFYISLSGILTFKNAQQLREVALAVPLNRLLIETDSPYLAPVPYRGKPNQPLYVKYVASTLATIKNCSIEEIAQATNDNFFRLFAQPLKAKNLP